MVLIMATSCASAWATPGGSCVYPNADAGGTGTGGTGMGGTGIVAKGAGIGGTGISPEDGKVAGNVILSQGTVEAQSNGRSRLLAQGEPVCVGETIATSQSGSVQIKMADDGLITVRPQTQLKIEKFVYGGTKQDNILLALLKGASRIITGQIGKRYPQNDLIRTPTVLVGVRGTDHEATVILPGNSGGYPSGTYDKVNSGVTFIRTERGEIDIRPNQVGFAANPGDMPVLLKEMPDFYSVNPNLKQPGGASEGVGKEKGPGETKQAEKAMDQSEKGAKPLHPSETGTPPVETHDRQNGMERPESPHPEQPEFPSQPERPEIPSLPEPPEPPAGIEH